MGVIFFMTMKISVPRQTHLTPSVGRHFYQFYRGREDLFRVLIPFLRLGLANKEACLWIVSRSVGILQAVEAFQREYDLTHFIETGQLLILPAERWYLDRGRFSKRKVLERVKKFFEEKRRRGFLAFRSVGDLGWIETGDWFEFQSYEEEIHEWFQTLRMTTICAYPIQNCSLTQTQDVISHHHSTFQTKL